MRVKYGKSSNWKHQSKLDLKNLHIDSILDCKTDGE